VSDYTQLFLVTPDRESLAFINISSKSRSLAKKIQDRSNHNKIEHDRREKDDHIICIKRNPLFDGAGAQRAKKAPRISNLDHGIEALHDQDKQHG
jgi:hypothetical protein